MASKRCTVSGVATGADKDLCDTQGPGGTGQEYIANEGCRAAPWAEINCCFGPDVRAAATDRTLTVSTGASLSHEGLSCSAPVRPRSVPVVRGQAHQPGNLDFFGSIKERGRDPQSIAHHTQPRVRPVYQLICPHLRNAIHIAERRVKILTHAGRHGQSAECQGMMSS